MKISKTGQIIGFILGFAIMILFGFFIFRCLISETEFNHKAYQIELQSELQYGLSHPSMYTITYIDGSSDTILVWSNKYGDEIYINDNSSTFTSATMVFIDYLPYKEYKEVPINFKRIRLYNILKYKKLN